MVRGFLSYLRSVWGSRRWKKRYMELYRGSRQEAEASWQRQLEVLKRRFPGQGEEWYARKVVYDLEKDIR